MNGVVARLLTLPGIRRLRAAQLRRLRPMPLRGTAILRYYWAQFLETHRGDIRGHCLEIGATATLRGYGGQAVTQADALDLAAHSPEINVVADLSRADHLAPDVYDCFVNQFTLHIIYDVEAALYHAVRILKPGGVLLANFACLYNYLASGLDMGTGGAFFSFWFFTPIQVENLLRCAGLTGADYQLTIYGNVFAQVASQMNLPAEHLTQEELDHVDPTYPLLICVRAVKPANWQAPKPAYRAPWLPAVQPARWQPPKR